MFQWTLVLLNFDLFCSYNCYNCSKIGFQSVDEFPDLLEAYPEKRVMYHGTNLMEMRADSHPSLLGWALRKEVFGIDGLTGEMIDSQNSPKRNDAVLDKTMKFKGVFLTSKKHDFVH